ncbi:MAG: hypothetical protein ACRCTD_07130 [Beijerinckiaceae bacterium]
MTNLPSDFYVMDETRIVAVHDDLIAQNPDLKSHAELINGCLDFIDWLLKLQDHRDGEHLALLRLGVRCFNSCGAALRLLRCGHWQPTILVIRDLYETQFLLDLLARDATKLKAWLTLSEQERKKQFKAVSIRQALDTLDGFTEKRREERYKMLSTYGAHATPEGFGIISPDGMTNIGPYPDQKLLKGVIEELAMVTAHAAATISPLVKPTDRDELARKLAFIEFLEAWRKRFLNHGSIESD